MKKILSLLISVFCILLAGTLFYSAQLDLEEGNKIGKGLFYLKGHYIEEKMMNGKEVSVEVYEQGPGVFTLPLVTSVLITGIYLLVRKVVKKKVNSQ